MYFYILMNLQYKLCILIIFLCVWPHYSNKRSYNNGIYIRYQSAVETIGKVPLKLLLTINEFRFQVGVLAECVSSESSDELFYQQIFSITSNFACFDKMSCFGLPFPSNCWNLGGWYPFNISTL